MLRLGMLICCDKSTESRTITNKTGNKSMQPLRSILIWMHIVNKSLTITAK